MKYSYQDMEKITLRYDSCSKFNQENNTKFYLIYKNGWIDLLKHMDDAFTEDNVLKKWLELRSRILMCKHYLGLYNFACKRGYMNKIIKKYPPIKDYKILLEDFKKYNNTYLWKIHNASYYSIACKYGYLDKIKKNSNLIKINKVDKNWNFETAIKDSYNYNSVTEWGLKSTAINYLRRNKLYLKFKQARPDLYKRTSRAKSLNNNSSD